MSAASHVGAALRIAQAPQFAALAFLLLLLPLLAATTPGFAAIENLTAIGLQIAVVGIVALAVNQIILSGEIDVSTGSLLALCCFVYGNIAQPEGGVALPLLGASVTGAAVGFVNGALVAAGGVPSIIATLGMQLLVRGVVLLWAANGVLSVPHTSRFLGIGMVAGVPIALVILILTYCAFALVSAHTTWGRDVIAIGSNPRAARAVGLRDDNARLRAFVVSGACCGLASAVYLGQIGQMQATVASGFELQVIAAVVLGGTSITGGRGSAVAPLIGAVLVGVILNALTLNSVPPTFEQFALGALILAAVAIDALRLRVVRGK